MFITYIQHKTEKTTTVILKVYEENQIPSIIFFESLPFWKCDNSSNVPPNVVIYIYIYIYIYISKEKNIKISLYHEMRTSNTPNN